jgi:hypothetical protein
MLVSLRYSFWRFRRQSGVFREIQDAVVAERRPRCVSHVRVVEVRVSGESASFDTPSNSIPNIQEFQNLALWFND